MTVRTVRTVRTVVSRLGEWMFRREVLAQARARVARRGEARDRAARQAGLVVEVARRVIEPVETLPPGAPGPVSLALYRSAAYWALVAGREREDAAPPDLPSVWKELLPDRLLVAAGNPVTLEAIRARLVEADGSRSLENSDDEVARARRFTEALVADLEVPRRRLDRILIQRWARTLLAAFVVVVVLLGLRRLAIGPNLADGKTYRTSSTWSGCVGDPTCAALLFHTDAEQDPWAELDLGAPTRFRRIEITNREDCCADRAVPMVVEISDDRTSWTEIARREQEFSTWTIKSPPRTARYLRFKILKNAALHLHAIVVRP
jgi:hypothetical protein